MNPKKILLFIICLAFGANALADNPRITRSGLPPTFDRFVYFLEGRWDNLRQVEKEALSDLAVDQRHRRYPMHYVRVDAGEIDGVVFAIHNYDQDGFHGDLRRISLHRFTWSKVHDHIVHEFLIIKDPDRFGPFDGRLDLLKQLTWNDVRTDPSCNMYWSWNVNHFEGKTVPGLCVTSSFTENPIRIEAHGELYASRLIRHDQNFTMEGREIKREGSQSPEIFDKETSRLLSRNP